ncbi:glycosyltransferase [Arsenicicoccus piscis]|uniref:Glycosyl transferase n=1 Tax=Arsenicicoccus piscis TaxID=673954 RepID=A0ABQ6HRJ4_9MICO|nr:glycosyltransferase [Arsenicicoccus piscis]MCH8629115.1 glycosyltransferase [Arsenicicoccus piscis]GMA20324.1 glycosyl transferase [Arsenicicoccus piscis]
MSTEVTEQVAPQRESIATRVDEDGYRVASRVMFPLDGDLDVLGLYIDFVKKDGQGSIHPDDVLGRHSVKVRAGRRMSLGSYFNAFPASYWRRWTVADHVRLTVRTSGDGNLIVYKSNARGNRQRVESVRVSGAGTVHSFDLPLTTFGDGGWYWFDLVAGTEALVLDGADWSVLAGDQPFGRTTLAVTTFNRPDYCVRTIGAVAGDADLRSVLDELIIVDQGNQKVEAEDGFEAVAAELGDQLRVINQPNLGGSGGFARGQYEAVTQGRSDYVILLDDDINLEPESIIRLTAFADMCRKPTLVGGHMFDLLNRSALHTFGEIVEPYRWQPALPAANQILGHDFNRRGLRETPWLHQRVDVDYNGWWMCLIPTKVIKEIGLSLPIFIKWDDSEYGLRAKEAGYPTVSLPGAAVWHVSWLDKDDLVGWQAYFHERNRIMTALMHSRFPHGGDVLRNSELNDLKHLVSMQYYTMTGRLKAQEDLLAGPDRLHEILPKRLGELRADAANHDDSVLKPEFDQYPMVRSPKPRRPRKVEQPGPGTVALEGLKAVARQFRPLRPGAYDNPQTQVAHKDNKWWNVAQHDSALVTNAEGTGIAWYRRRPEQMRSMLMQSSLNHARLLAEWKSLRETYQEALPRITSFEAWEKTFGIERGDAPDQH